MSGPIVRKYGFPNFENIFGKRELKHGAEEESSTPPTPAEPPKPTQDGSADKAGPGTPSSAINPNSAG